jgi:hypothetical protein
VSGKTSIPVYRIHPAIGIARLGNSTEAFCISPETPAALPIACDAKGNELPAAQQPESTFKDADGRIKRQAARFQIYVYDDETPEGRPLEIGNVIEGGGNRGPLKAIQWRVYLANKKSAWYEFRQLEGEHGYAPDHPLRNAAITDDDARQCLIIDPGPKVVDSVKRRSARFDRSGDGLYAPTFPPEKLEPRKIETLGELLTDDGGRLLVLGGHGHSGSYLDGFGQPRIDTYANNDGWFDDTSDGPVMARLMMESSEVDRPRFIDVEYPAWVVSAYPAYVPEILDIVTLDDVMYNTAVTEFAYRTDLYGKTGTFAQPQIIDPKDDEALALWKASNLSWNPEYKPWFYRDIWPILFRADEYTYLTNVLQQSNAPHNQTNRGNFDPTRLSVPPSLNVTAYGRARDAAVRANQTGELFLDALEPVLQQSDQRAQNTPGSANVKLLAAFHAKSDVRAQVLAAVKAFAAKVDGGAPVVDAEAYIAHWQKRYTDAQTGDDAEAIEYKNASEELFAALREVLKELEPPKVKTLLKRRPEDERGHVRADEPVEAAIERLYTAFRTGRLMIDKLARLVREHTYDPFGPFRTFLFDVLRHEGEENVFRLDGRPTSRTNHLPLMPLLNGDNPISNTLPSKFLRLTDYQLYFLRQWSRGLFFNEIEEGWVKKEDIDVWEPYKGIVNKTARELDQNVLSNLGGGAFCPGAEVGWIIRNPAIYLKPYRLKADLNFASFLQTAANQNQSSRADFVPEEDYVAATGVTLSQSSDYRTGLQPGDLTKLMALPWQADFNECSTQDVDVTYEEWNNIYPKSVHDKWMEREQQVWETLWWPAHRPMQVWEKTGVDGKGNPILQFLSWARGIPQTNAGDLKMVTEWSKLGFVVRNPYPNAGDLDQASPNSKYVSVERNPDA